MIVAQATNLGLSRMADASGIGYDTLLWTQEWYVREETLRAANHSGKAGQTGGPHAPICGHPTNDDPQSQRNDHRIFVGGSGLRSLIVESGLMN